ncbi:LuxR family transcriptional regulator [Streptomyces sp. L2]|uniref:ATP-binding protein n=1 Tax=Streptomyces sp. L2 TaxID=2162665 RepID=UPI0010108094|nr:LuxR family transcriptional regulator [Streptomyces sp. L2]
MRTRAAVLVGRSSELATLGTYVDDARRSRGGAVFLAGEPGIGKSRLLREALDSASAAGMPVLRGRGSSTGPAVPFRPLAEALLSATRGGLDPARWADLGPYRPVLGRLVPEWAEREEPRGDASLVVLAEGILRLTTLAGREHGCVLALEDLHEADPETLAVVEYLAGNLAGQPVLLLATLRSGAGGAAVLADELTRRGDGTVLTLPRLDRPQVHALMATCLETRPECLSDGASERVWQDSGGNPLMVEELLHSMITSGDLVDDEGVWRPAGTAVAAVPPTLLRVIGARADRLGDEVTRLLSVAALLGRRFPLTLVRRVLGLPDHALLGEVRSAVEAQLLVRDEHQPGWYAFAHPLALEALRGRLAADELTALARRAAEETEAAHPGLPGEWCQLAARLREFAGEPVEAARLYVECGRRATADGAPGSATAVLRRARATLAQARGGSAHHEVRRDLLEALLHALAEDGQFEQAVGVVDELTLYAPGDRARRIDRHIRLAWAAQVSGHWAEGHAQVTAARELAPGVAGPEQLAALDAVAAYLAILSPAPDRLDQCDRLARSAVELAAGVPLPSVICQGWYAIGYAARERDLAESDACFRRALEAAVAHRLPMWRNYALTGLGGNAWLAEGDAGPLRHAHAEMLRCGAIGLAQNAAAVLGLSAVLAGEFERAERELAACLAESRRLQLVAVTHYVLTSRVVLAAHRGRREEMRAALDEFTALAGDESAEASQVHGLGAAFCALLEEDRPAAEQELARVTAERSRRQTPFHLDGQHGLGVLLDVLAGRAGEERVRSVAATNSGRMRWNRHFLALAEAVLAGRGGQAEAVTAAMARAGAAGRVFGMARCLGLRLVAEPAAVEGWGEPKAWLREAEEHFHQAGVGPVAAACRTLLRRLGEPVRQRRSGTERIPEPLRQRGLTAREYEVLELMPERLGNKALAARLHISPRTAEKHVASLLQKTGLPDRDTLFDRARELLSRGVPGAS